MQIFILRTFRRRTAAIIAVAVCAFIVLGLAVYPSLAQTKDLAAKDILQNKVIAIDPGHGGADPGAVGVSGSLEKDVNLRLSLYLEKYLTKNGAKVVLTRSEDVALSEVKKEDLDARAEIVAEAKADIFISMQCNAIPDQTCQGAQVFFYPESTKGERLATEVQSQLWSQTEQVKKREAQTISAPYILKAVDIPAIIVEAGFLSNPEEEALLLDPSYQKKVAKSVYQGIIEYYRSAPTFLFF